MPESAIELPLTPECSKDTKDSAGAGAAIQQKTRSKEKPTLISYKANKTSGQVAMQVPKRGGSHWQVFTSFPGTRQRHSCGSASLQNVYYTVCKCNPRPPGRNQTAVSLSGRLPLKVVVTWKVLYLVIFKAACRPSLPLPSESRVCSSVGRSRSLHKLFDRTLATIFLESLKLCRPWVTVS